jgi:RNA polymerase sigma-70 factor (ECF subfamily)
MSPNSPSGESPPPGGHDAGSLTESSIRLFDRARGGSADAIELLYRRYLPRLRRWASGRLPRTARGILDTDDLVQEVLMRSVRHVGSFEPRGDVGFYGYLRRGLTNRIRDEIRRARRTPETAELAGDELAAGPTPLEEVIGRQHLERYESALGRLRVEEREAIVARIEMGCSYQEVADALGKPSPDAARMAVARALVRLAKEMNTDA